MYIMIAARTVVRFNLRPISTSSQYQLCTESECSSGQSILQKLMLLPTHCNIQKLKGHKHALNRKPIRLISFSSSGPKLQCTYTSAQYCDMEDEQENLTNYSTVRLKAPSVPFKRSHRNQLLLPELESNVHDLI